MPRWKPLALLVLPSLLSSMAPAAAQDADGAAPRDPVATVPDSGAVEVLVLGSYHFGGGPNFNYAGAPEQQAEILDVVEGLEAFRPTKAAVEEEPADSARMDSLYTAFREGRHELETGRDRGIGWEDEQIGFRLARRAGLERLWAIDYKHPWPMDKVESFARRFDSSFVRWQRRWREEMGAIQDSLHRHATVGGILRWMNSPDFLSRLQAARMRSMEVDAGGTYVGLEPNVSIWRRNMRIFANLVAVAEPGDRIVVVYGAGHAYFLRKFALQHPRMTLVEPGPYLPAP